MFLRHGTIVFVHWVIV